MVPTPGLLAKSSGKFSWNMMAVFCTLHLLIAPVTKADSSVLQSVWCILKFNLNVIQL